MINDLGMSDVKGEEKRVGISIDDASCCAVLSSASIQSVTNGFVNHNKVSVSVGAVLAATEGGWIIPLRQEIPALQNQMNGISNNRLRSLDVRLIEFEDGIKESEEIFGKGNVEGANRIKYLSYVIKALLEKIKERRGYNLKEAIIAVPAFAKYWYASINGDVDELEDIHDLALTNCCRFSSGDLSLEGDFLLAGKAAGILQVQSVASPIAVVHAYSDPQDMYELGNDVNVIMNVEVQKKGFVLTPVSYLSGDDDNYEIRRPSLFIPLDIEGWFKLQLIGINDHDYNHLSESQKRDFLDALLYKQPLKCFDDFQVLDENVNRSFLDKGAPPLYQQKGVLVNSLCEELYTVITGNNNFDKKKEDPNALLNEESYHNFCRIFNLQGSDYKGPGEQPQINIVSCVVSGTFASNVIFNGLFQEVFQNLLWKPGTTLEKSSHGSKFAAAALGATKYSGSMNKTYTAGYWSDIEVNFDLAEPIKKIDILKKHAQRPLLIRRMVSDACKNAEKCEVILTRPDNKIITYKFNFDLEDRHKGSTIELEIAIDQGDRITLTSLLGGRPFEIAVPKLQGDELLTSTGLGTFELFANKKHRSFWESMNSLSRSDIQPWFFF